MDDLKVALAILGPLVLFVAIAEVLRPARIRWEQRIREWEARSLEKRLVEYERQASIEPSTHMRAFWRKQAQNNRDRIAQLRRGRS